MQDQNSGDQDNNLTQRIGPGFQGPLREVAIAAGGARCTRAVESKHRRLELDSWWQGSRIGRGRSLSRRPHSPLRLIRESSPRLRRWIGMRKMVCAHCRSCILLCSLDGDLVCVNARHGCGAEGLGRQAARRSTSCQTSLRLWNRIAILFSVAWSVRVGCSLWQARLPSRLRVFVQCGAQHVESGHGNRGNTRRHVIAWTRNIRRGKPLFVPITSWTVSSMHIVERKISCAKYHAQNANIKRIIDRLNPTFRMPA